MFSNIANSVILILAVSWNIILCVPNLEYQSVTDESRRLYLMIEFDQSESLLLSKYRAVVNKNKPENLLLEEIKNHQDNFYGLNFASNIQNIYFEWAPWEAVTPGYYSNFSYLAGITDHHPDVIRTLMNSGIANIIDALMSGKMYLVDDYQQYEILTYIQEHYDPEASIELYREAGGYYLWKFCTVEGKEKSF